MKCLNCGGYLSEIYFLKKKVRRKYCTQKCGWIYRSTLKKEPGSVRNSKVVPKGTKMKVEAVEVQK